LTLYDCAPSTLFHDRWMGDPWIDTLFGVKPVGAVVGAVHAVPVS
jgi:hypothetical protein